MPHTRRWFVSSLPLLLLAAGSARSQPSAAVAPEAALPVESTAGARVEDAATYRQHVLFLSSPFLEGRGPGTRGNAIAADYLEFWFKELGLRPAFDPYPDPPGEPPTARTVRCVYRQPFAAGERAEHRSSRLSLPYEERLFTRKAQERLFEHGEWSYTAFGFSGNGAVTGPLAFVGYSMIGAGPDKTYSSYAEGDGLAGKIALILRFEPMTPEGKSAWRHDGDGRWTADAAIADKIRNAVERGAAGLIVVDPLGVDGSSAAKLSPVEATSNWFRRLDIPAVMMSSNAADTLVRNTDPQGRSLRDLTALADTQGGPVLVLDKVPVTLDVELERVPRQTWNVAGILPGRGELKDQYLIIGAHYDHVGRGYTGGSASNEYGLIHPGADDNASGAAGLLLAAERLRRAYEAAPADRPLRSILFIGFSAEEMGLLGSRHFIRNAPIDASSVDAMLNLDMIGRVRDGKVEVAGVGTAVGFEDLLRPLFDASGLSVTPKPGGRGPSDHAAFYGVSIPVLAFFSGLHPEYHTPRDTVDLINVDGAVRVVDLVTEIALTLAARPERLRFTPTHVERGAQPAVSLGDVRVRFGIAPAYNESEPGVGVEGVSDGTAAAEAGVQAGDRLLRWNEQEIENIEHWMTLLARHAPGDVVDVTLRRAGEERVVRVTLKSRDQAPK